MTKQKVENFYDVYSKKYKKTHSSRFIDQVFEYFCLKNLPRKDKLKILDAGGGIGRFSFNLAKKGHSIVLTDISKEMLQEARETATKMKLNNVIFLRESVTNMKNQKSDYFDVVLMMNGVLDYCRNHRKAIAEVYRVLRKGGVFIVTVNNRFIYTTTNVLLREKNIKKFERSFKTGNYCEQFPIHDFTLRELKALLTRNKFKIRDILGPTNLLRKWEYERIIGEVDKKDLLRLQIEFSKKKEYLNNSSDFLIYSKKV